MTQEYKTIAENVVSQMRKELGVELKYDKESIEWLDHYIDRIRPQLKKESYAGLAMSLGAYVGETIIAAYGGAWDYFPKLDQWGIRFGAQNGAFPFSKVYKQLEGGEMESILSFFTILPRIIDETRTES